MRRPSSGPGYALKAGDEREARQHPNFGVVHGPLPIDRCVEMTLRSLERVRRPEGLASLGLMLAQAGRFEEARAALQEGVALARDRGIELRLASIHMYYGAAMLLADEPAEAVLRPAVEALQRMGEKSMMSTAVAILAEALYRQGKLDDAMATTIVSEEATASDDLASEMAWRGVREIAGDRSRVEARVIIRGLKELQVHI